MNLGIFINIEFFYSAYTECPESQRQAEKCRQTSKWYCIDVD